jgi:arsenical pump membrane protein
VSGRFAGVLLIVPALVLDASAARSALAQAWPPFVLVTGLLAIGLVADRDGLFDAAAARLQALPGSPLLLFLACLALVAVVTALLNLDTSAVFLTPVLVKTARRRGISVEAFLYGAIFMANASSLFLPGSNLTNLLVLSREHVSGASFFARMLPSALGATLVTAAGLLLLYGRRLRIPASVGCMPQPTPARPRRSLGLCAGVAAAVLILVLHNAAPEVLAVGLLALAWRARSDELALRESLPSLGLGSLLSLFALAVALGTAARASALPASLLHGAGTATSAVIAALASVLVNNLPAAVVLSAPKHVHLMALLAGLDIGPNVAVTGSLAVLLWWRAARASDASPSARAYSAQGLMLAPAALAVAVALQHI